MINKKSIEKIARETINIIQKIDFSQLDISDYNKKYISSLLPHLDYYFEIYADAIIRIQKNGITSEYFIDFGGGHGFLSLFLKRLKMNVIYCDHNPLSVNTVTIIKAITGFGPDIIIEGSSSELKSYCKTNNILPKYLIATDLIEHIYDLNCFFSDFQTLNPSLEMIFTTGSVKSNILKTKKLRKIMIEEEANIYFPIRKQFITEKYPDIASNEIDKLTKSTRGMIFSDIIKNVDIYLETSVLSVIDIDKYNTCDPRTGNWTERILSKKQYRKIINNNHFQVAFKNGFYNENRSNPFLSFIIMIINFFIRYLGIFGAKITPFLILKLSPK